MIENIAIEKCTGCGICDIVCPADVIHMESQPVDSGIAGLRQTKVLPVIKFREHCITCFSCEIFCPEQIVDGLNTLTKIGLDGVLLNWPRYETDMRWFQKRIYPMLIQAGLR